MAAELLLTFAMEETLTRVSFIAAEVIRLAWGLEGQLRKLDESLTMIQAVLRDAATRPATEERVKLWSEKLQDVAYDAEDVLDEFAYEILRKDQKKGKVRDCFSLHNPAVFRLIMGQKVKKITGALDEIRKDAAGFGFGWTSLHVDRAQEVSWDPDRETDSFLDSSEVVVGREDDVSKVVELLTSLTKYQHVISVVTLVGMAGLGKTTIAKQVCEVVRERKHFDVTLWVCVSDDFNKVKILGAMLQMIDKTTGGLNSLDAILQNLKKELENKTFLLVLDDVWNEEIAKRCGGTSISSDLESIGKEIAKRCGGIPLLAKVLGGTLQWSHEGNSSVNNEDVLEGLEPHPDIISLTMEGYEGENFPSWMSILPLNNLMDLRLKGCRKCRQLPTLRCSLLEENCRKDNGSEWPKISHIPSIVI